MKHLIFVFIFKILWINHLFSQCVSWTPTSMINPPVARKEHVAVWIGDRMFIWGGETVANSIKLGDGALYDPLSDTWTPVSNLNAPSPRTNAAGVWTGTEVIIWGGADGITGEVNTGAKYNPLTDTWSSISQVNTFRPKYFQKTSEMPVWTGSEMIIMGDHNGSFGRSYNPINDVWTAIPNSGFPKFNYFSQIWTGTDVLIWGGAGPYPTYTNRGFLYNPSTQTWSEISNIGAPSARALPDLFLVGNKAIVWGGIDDDEVFNDGGMYDFTSNTWVPMATINSPSQRVAHISISSGTKFIVWSGSTRTTQPKYNNGAEFDPIANSWTPLTQMGVPSRRRSAAGVWTGSKMIVWSGDNSLYYGDPGIPDGGILSFENTNPGVEINGTAYSSINDAINASAANDTIIVTSDICENLFTSLPVNRVLIIPSQYKVDLFGTLTNNGIIINDGTIKASGLTFNNNGSYKGTGNYIGNFLNNGSIKPGD